MNERSCALAGTPEGFHTITPQIHVSNGDKAIALYKKALGAKELHRMLAPGTKTTSTQHTRRPRPPV
jgi:uncharacterized glyoxalase superfamily protein PhnB